MKLLLCHCQSTPWVIEETRPDGLNALHLATLNSRTEVVDLLLQAGINASTPTGSTIMMLPQSSGTGSITQQHPWLRESRLSPLHLAVHRAQANVVCLLLCHGASPSAKDCKSRTPLTLALQLIAQKQPQTCTLTLGRNNRGTRATSEISNDGSNSKKTKRLDISLVPFLASVSRLLIRMAESFITSQQAQQSNEDSEQLLALTENRRASSVDFSTLETPSALYQRIQSTVHASLETGISRLVLISACLAAASGFEKGFLSLRATMCNDGSQPNNNQHPADAGASLECLETPSMFHECLDPVLRLALQQCYMEAMISAAQRAQQSMVYIKNQGSSNQLTNSTIIEPEALVEQVEASLNIEEDILDPITVEKPSCSFSWQLQLPDSLSISNCLEDRPFTNIPVELNEGSATVLVPLGLSQMALSIRECLVCSEADRNVVLVPCGHVVTCENCAMILKKCLHCRAAINSYQKIPACRECTTRPATILTRPCNHLLVCSVCLVPKINRLKTPKQESVPDSCDGSQNTSSRSEEQALQIQKTLHQLLLAGELCTNRCCPDCNQAVQSIWALQTACLGISTDQIDRQHQQAATEFQLVRETKCSLTLPLPNPAAAIIPARSSPPQQQQQQQQASTSNGSTVPYDRELRRLQHELQVMREQTRCPICLDRSRNLVFMCGHSTCQWCGDQVTQCPICRRAVGDRIVLY